MRVIGGKLKGTKIHAPTHLPVRPTTDMAKEALFNILHNQYQISNASVLDLFSGTGHIAVEFASRDAKEITCVDISNACVRWIQELNKKHQLCLKVVKNDVFKFLKTPLKPVDFIFADPPYQLGNIPEIAQLVFEHQWLTPQGILIIEHQSLQKLDTLPHFMECRKYGNSTFSFFKKTDSL